MWFGCQMLCVKKNYYGELNDDDSIIRYNGLPSFIGSGCASVLNAHSSNGSNESSENKRYKY